MRLRLEIDLDSPIFSGGIAKANLCEALDNASESIFVHNTDDLSPEIKQITMNGEIVGQYFIEEEPKDKAKQEGKRYYVEQIEDDPEYYNLMDRINGEVKDTGSESSMEDEAELLNSEIDDAWESNKQ